jgi:hypothetical protein
MILVSVFGDFQSSILPVFYQFRHKIKKHIIIYDDFKCDTKEANNTISGIKRFCDKYSLDIQNISYKIDEDSKNDINKVINFIKQHTIDITHLYINTTDGLSSINTLLTLHFVPLGANILSYDRYDNECNIISKNDMQSYRLDDVTSIQDHFLLKNLYVESIGNKEFALSNAEPIISIFEKHHIEFKRFANHVIQNTYPTFKGFNNIANLLNQMGIHKDDLKTNQLLITGGLFEYYIFLKLKELPYHDIEIGIVIKQYYNNTDFIPNEFDILIMKDNHLHMIECKYTNKIKLDQLVYKYMGLKNLIDDDGKIVMVTSHEKSLPNEQLNNPLYNLPYTRAKANKMLLLDNPLKDIDGFITKVKDFCELY